MELAEKLKDVKLTVGAKTSSTGKIFGAVGPIQLADAFEKAGMKPEMAEVTMKALNETSLSGEDAERMQRLIDALEDLDDVQQVYTTAVFED